MRNLNLIELQHVSGGCSLPVGYEPGDEIPTCETRRKGNNGFGNGGDDGVPGNSGKTGGGKAEDIYR